MRGKGKIRYTLDWSFLPADSVVQIFSLVNYRDRANLSSTCKTWWAASKHPSLWKGLDLHHYKFDVEAALSLASRCNELQKIRLNDLDVESKNALEYLKAKKLTDIRFDRITSVKLYTFAGHHGALQSLHIDRGDEMTSDDIIAVAIGCPNLKKLRLFHVHRVDVHAFNALAKYCPTLTDIGFANCENLDETALGNIKSVRFVSIPGSVINLGVGFTTLAQPSQSNRVRYFWNKYRRRYAFKIILILE